MSAMNWKNVRLIYQREVRDQIRDRRTLFMVVVLPLLLYPGLAIGMVQASFLFREQPRTVVVLGTANLPETPPLLNGDRFAARWFTSPDDVDKLHVFRDDETSQADPAEAKQRPDLLAEARELRVLVEQLEGLQRGIEAARKNGNSADEERLSESIRSAKEQLAEKFSGAKIQVLVIIPAGLKEQVARINRGLPVQAKDGRPATDGKEIVRALVVENSADEKSMFAFQRVKPILTAWEQQILQERLTAAKLPPTWSSPVNPLTIDVAVAKQLSANLWSKLFPTLLIIMAVTGAFYPAVDVAAGEKERGTMETLLICPARRSEIVLGKFFTVLTFSVSTVLLNLTSMGATGKYLVAAARSDALAKIGAGALSFPGAREMLWLVILLVPLATFYSAISLALATFARSTKEGQYYLTPLLLVTLGLTMFCLSPAVEIEPFFSILPVVGPALLLKEVLATPGSSAPLVYGIPVLVSSIAYSLAGLWWAIAMFNREDVLFREAERFDIRLWIRHLLRDKEPTPSSAEAVLCFVLILMLQFVASRFMQVGLFTADGKLIGLAMMRLLLVQQMVLVGCPALFMGIMLTTSVVRTFRLRLPPWEHLAMACVLPLAIYPLSVGLETWLQDWFFPPLPKHVVELMGSLSDPALPLWLILLAMAVAPAVCEETAYRGFILSGFARSARPAVAIIMSAVAFGITHMVPQQVFNATLLGLVLGLLAIRSGSLLPGIVFHLIYNSIELLRVRAASLNLNVPIFDWFFSSTKEGGASHPHWPALVVAALIATLLIARLALYGRRPQKGLGVEAERPHRERETAAPPSAQPPLPMR